ncbi:MAG: peptidase U32 family protein [Promethearchaeota archaeon]
MEKKALHPEILAPLNNWKSLNAQKELLENADAFYFGLRTNFSMRARAGNFPPEDLPNLVKTIHKHGKKAYLTTNILIYNVELIELHQSIEIAKKAGVDAIICHDLSAIMICKQLGIPFHISTQANISNKISAKFYETLGAERIILARELNLDEIGEIVKDVSIPVECFVHGAMCTAVSGRCYLSAELMGFDPAFSANRGKCVQPCRRYYAFQGEENEQINYEPVSGMFFNAKDLCMIEHIPDLIDSGISSFKIEGRMRDPLYINEAVACYKEAIDSYYEGTYGPEKVQNWLTRLKKVFNRGFHTGFYFSKPDTNKIEREKRGNVSQWKKQQVGKVVNFYRKASAVEIELSAGSLKVGDEIIFENRTDFFLKQIIASLQIENKQVERTKIASANHHILIGMKVSRPVPINASVFLFHKSAK